MNLNCGWRPKETEAKKFKSNNRGWRTKAGNGVFFQGMFKLFGHLFEISQVRTRTGCATRRYILVMDMSSLSPFTGDQDRVERGKGGSSARSTTGRFVGMFSYGSNNERQLGARVKNP